MFSALSVLTGMPQIRDAVAVMQLLYHLERTVPEGKETELTAALLVDKYRR